MLTILLYKFPFEMGFFFRNKLWKEIKLHATIILSSKVSYVSNWNIEIRNCSKTIHSDSFIIRLIFFSSTGLLFWPTQSRLHVMFISIIMFRHYWSCIVAGLMTPLFIGPSYRRHVLQFNLIAPPCGCCSAAPFSTWLNWPRLLL